MGLAVPLPVPVPFHSRSFVLFVPLRRGGVFLTAPSKCFPCFDAFGNGCFGECWDLHSIMNHVASGPGIRGLCLI